MAKFFDEIPEFLFPWIMKQHLFWVATCPLSPTGHINVSPKGVEGSFHIVNSTRVWYEDLSGSGVETIAHLRENGRITVMFSAFEGPPRISRLFGTGTVHEFGTPEYDAYIPVGTRKPGSRAVIVVDVYKASTSCGFAVPFYEFKSHRNQLLQYFERRETVDRSFETEAPSSPTDSGFSEDQPRPKNGMREYWEKNTASLDGLPGITVALHSTKRLVTEDVSYLKKMDDIRVREENAVWSAVKDVKFGLGFSAGIVVATVGIIAFLKTTRRA